VRMWMKERTRCVVRVLDLASWFGNWNETWTLNNERTYTEFLLLSLKEIDLNSQLNKILIVALQYCMAFLFCSSNINYNKKTISFYLIHFQNFKFANFLFLRRIMLFSKNFLMQDREE
jgi:hypothetical protein